MGVFCKKVENGGVVCKSGPFFNAGCIMYSINIFYFTFYLFGGAYAPNSPPLPTGLLSLRPTDSTSVVLVKRPSGVCF